VVSNSLLHLVSLKTLRERVACNLCIVITTEISSPQFNSFVPLSFTSQIRKRQFIEELPWPYPSNFKKGGKLTDNFQPKATHRVPALEPNQFQSKVLFYVFLLFLE
jgi:hypothetical protein